MDDKLKEKIILTDGKATVELPLENIVRLSMIYLKDYFVAYDVNNNTVTAHKVWDWIMKERLGVDADKKDSVLL